MLTVLHAMLVELLFSFCVGLALKIPKHIPGMSDFRVLVTANGTMRQEDLISDKIIQGMQQINLSQFEQITYHSNHSNHTVYFNDDLDVILDPQLKRPPEINLIRGVPGPALRNGLKNAPEGRRTLQKFLQCKIKGLQHMDHDNRIYELILHHGRGVLFTHIFKNGGTSVAKFAMQSGGKFLTHDNLKQNELQKIYNDDTYFRGAIVRDPVDRVLASFVETMCLVMPEKCNVEVRFLADSNGTKRPIEYLGRMENFEKEVRFMFPFDEKLPHQKDHKGFRINETMLTPHLLVQICKVYFDDFCCFGYDFPEPCKEVMSCNQPESPKW